MVGPARKREAVGHLQRELEMSERRACKVVGQPRSTQRYLVVPDTEELYPSGPPVLLRGEWP